MGERVQIGEVCAQRKVTEICFSYFNDSLMGLIVSEVHSQASKQLSGSRTCEEDKNVVVEMFSAVGGDCCDIGFGRLDEVDG